MNKKVTSKMIWSDSSLLNHIIRNSISEGMVKAFTPKAITSSFSATGQKIKLEQDIMRTLVIIHPILNCHYQCLKTSVKIQ